MCFYTNAQSAKIEGKVMSNGKSVENASIKLSNTQNATLTDSVGAYVFSNLQAGNYILVVTRVGFSAAVKD